MDKILRNSVLTFVLFLGAIVPSRASNLAIRLGLWHLTNADFSTDSALQTNRQKNYMYVEAALENRLAPPVSFDVSLGTLFRGTTRYQTTSGERFVGTANVLPMSVGFSFYPFPFAGVEPYLRIGGTAALGNQNSGNFSGFDASGNPVFNSKTRFTAGFFGGAGFKYKLFTKVDLLTEFSYHQLKFSGPIAGISNHSGYKILAGVSINYK
ncbi:MAG: outer membrane beta-barrel protein [Candidatus Zixiibacteriota bacterium]|nr:outer membrane beta-barrel protein [candidate division Zixibacteria bacterium]